MSEFALPDDLNISDNIFDDLLQDLEFEDFGDFGSFPAGSVGMDADEVLPNTGYLSSPVDYNIPALPVLPMGPPMQSGPDHMDSFEHLDRMAADGTSTKQSAKRKSDALQPVLPHPSQPSPTSKSVQIDHPMTQFPVSLFKAFNGGDLTKVQELIHKHTTEQVALKTPALDDAVHGQEHIVRLLSYISDSHPDAVWVAKKCKYLEIPSEDGGGDVDLGMVRCKIYFAGTRVMSSAGNSTNIMPSNVADYSYLFKRPNSSLLDEMDVSSLSEMEVTAMRMLERKGRNLSVFGKGNLSLHLSEDGRISSMEFDWVVTSFREADL